MEKVLVMFGNAMVPLIVGGIIAYAVNILMGFFEKNYDRVLRGRRAQRAKRTVCIICAYLLLVLIIAGIIYFITGILFNSLRQPLAILLIVPISFVGLFLTFFVFKLKKIFNI